MDWQPTNRKHEHQNWIECKLCQQSSLQYELEPQLMVQLWVQRNHKSTYCNVGKVFSLDFTNPGITLRVIEVFAYSQEAIQNFANFMMTFEDPSFPASNLIGSISAIRTLTVSGQKCVSSLTSAVDPQLKSTLKASILIDGVAVVSADDLLWLADSYNIQVYVLNIQGYSQLCGTISDYSYQYQEIECNFVGNQVVVKRTGNGVRLGLCSLGIFSSCDCSKSSFDPVLMPHLGSSITTQSVIADVGGQAIPLTSILTINSVDTVSLVCAPADGVTSCGKRVVDIYETCRNKTLSVPHPFISWDGTSQLLVQSNSETDVGIWEFVVSVSLLQFPAVKRSTTVTVTIQSTKTVPTALCNKITTIEPTSSDHCQKTVITQLDKQTPKSTQITLTKLVDNPFKIILPQVTDSFSDSISQIQSCDQFYYFVKGGSTDLVKLEKSNLLLTFESTMPAAVPGTYSISVFASLSKYPMIPSLEIPFVFTLLESSKTNLTLVKQEQDIQNETEVGFDTTDSNSELNHTIVKPSTIFVDVHIKSIDYLGNFIIVFDSRIAIGDIYAIQNGIVQKDGVKVPGFQVKVVPGSNSNPELLLYTYNITNMTERTLSVKLLFQNPIEVSAESIDLLEIKFNDIQYFKGASGEILKEGTAISSQLPPQMKYDNMTTSLIQVKNLLTPSSQTYTVVNFALNFLLAATLQQLWSMINAQQIILVMIAFQIKPPGISTMFFNVLFQISSVNVIPWSDLYDDIFQMEHTEPLSVNLDSLGYSNRYFIYNVGSSILPLALLPVQLTLWFLFSRCKKIKCFNYLRGIIEKRLFWNGTITTMNESWSAVVLSGYISIYAVSKLLQRFQLKWGTAGEILSSSMGMFLLTLQSLYPLVMVIVYLKHFDNFEQLKPKIGNMYDGIRLKSGRITVLLPFFHFIRRAVYAYTIVFSQQFFVQFGSLILTVQVQLIIICYCNPYESVFQRRMEFFNETMVTLIMYSIICYTDFIPDTNMRYQLDYVSIVLICIHFTVNVVFLLKTNCRQVFLVFKRYFKRLQEFIAKKKKIQQKMEEPVQYDAKWKKNQRRNTLMPPKVPRLIEEPVPSREPQIKPWKCIEPQVIDNPWKCIGKNTKVPLKTQIVQAPPTQKFEATYESQLEEWQSNWPSSQSFTSQILDGVLGRDKIVHRKQPQSIRGDSVREIDQMFPLKNQDEIDKSFGLASKEAVLQTEDIAPVQTKKVTFMEIMKKLDKQKVVYNRRFN